ncbi:iron ABC transporter [Aureimonas ureilytica]|uniref:Iron ABC transporter n=1 Tax=Aureimonas ureilytica TaxID=401562 RepID=A0A175RS91_9HYPH|nr:heme ABC transporter ATP-binding protein [Aureimonas ureilytica]KTR05692.1 iron ABC transporter [Aureimonas ureilytica]
MLTLSSASLAYHGRTVVHPLDLAIEPGMVTIVIGPNGAGKSSLLKLMTGEVEPSGGDVRLDGQPFSRWTPERLARRRAVLPQSSSLAFPFTVTEVVRFGLEAGGRAREPAAIQIALARVDLAGFAGRLYEELSGGEQQRVHLARVLCQIGAPVAEGHARLLFLDEPVSSLDIRHQLGVLQIARDFAEGGGAVVAVLHDLNLAAGFADRLVAMAGGRVAADGPPAEVLTDRLVEEVFGVRLPVGATPFPPQPFVLPQTAAQIRNAPWTR